MKTIALLSAAAIAAGAHAVPDSFPANPSLGAGAPDALPIEGAAIRDDGGDDTAAAEAAKSDVQFVLAGGYAHFFATDFDSGGGDVSVDRGFGSLSMRSQSSADYAWDLGLQWEGSWYAFGDGSALAAAAGGKPWDAVQGVSISPGASFVLDERWRLVTRLIFDFAGESDADAGDSFSFGGVAAATYSFSREFTLGAGVLAITRIEDDALVVPQVIIDWRPCKEFRLSNFAGPEAYPGGAGLEGIWVMGDEYELALGARYTYRRFRLDDTGAPQRANGVGTDEGMPLWIRATHRAKCGARLDLVAGMQLAGEMSIDDAAGNELASVDVEPAPFVGVFFSWRY
jgi:hypothetical protein